MAGHDWGWSYGGREEARRGRGRGKKFSSAKFLSLVILSKVRKGNTKPGSVRVWSWTIWAIVRCSEPRTCQANMNTLSSACRQPWQDTYIPPNRCFFPAVLPSPCQQCSAWTRVTPSQDVKQGVNFSKRPLHQLAFSHRLVGLVVQPSASKAEGPGFESRLRRDFFGVESYQWLKNWHSSGYPARRLAI